MQSASCPRPHSHAWWVAGGCWGNWTRCLSPSSSLAWACSYVGAGMGGGLRVPKDSKRTSPKMKVPFLTALLRYSSHMLLEFEFCFLSCLQGIWSMWSSWQKEIKFPEPKSSAYNEDSVFMQAVCGICDCRGNLEEITSWKFPRGTKWQLAS